MRKIIVSSLRKRAGIVSALSVLIAAFSSAAIAQCGGSFSSMAAVAASIQSKLQVSQSPVQNKSAVNDAGPDNGVNSSIVGFWHIRFLVGDQTIQEAFQIWNEGGTEAHNPNVDPRTGNICFGAWKMESRESRQGPRQTFKLTHRVWNYDELGNFHGTINLSETLTLGNGGNSHTGSFTLDFYDPFGTFLFEVPGTVIGERISVK